VLGGGGGSTGRKDATSARCGRWGRVAERRRRGMPRGVA
jgi:hypothetical protein